MTFYDETNNKIKLLVLIGPTAVGKTVCSINLAEALRGEIISGDSMQFYRHMDIGTAKIDKAEMYSQKGQFIPHHFIDIINPDQNYSVADFQKAATETILEINQRGKLPILAGGTGLYVNALTEGYTLNDQAPEDENFRLAKKQEFLQKGGEALWQELEAVDPNGASKIDPNDCKRLVRALEVFHITGQPLSKQAKKNPPDWDIAWIGLNMDRAMLYQRIDQRVIKMIDDGLVSEVQSLLNMGYGSDLKPMEGLGYKQICKYLAGDITLDEAIVNIQQKTRNFAKRQLTWWRKDQRIKWFDVLAYEDSQALGLDIIKSLK